MPRATGINPTAACWLLFYSDASRAEVWKTRVRKQAAGPCHAYSVPPPESFLEFSFGVNQLNVQSSNTRSLDVTDAFGLG